MRLIFDQNLSPMLIGLLSDLFPGSIHVRDAGLHASGDEAVWDHAIQEQFVIISKDSDFRQRSFLFGSPPMVVWIRRGNCSTSEIADLLKNTLDQLEEFNQNEQGSFLALG